ncbi:hypothetical protein ACHRVW_23455, partial [Flavobacterium collinsii]|uniref:hypothetical protein n=1 Tax=Flavobacterium collinsii TaxID=1114861 RepID=UPI00375792A2
FSFENPSPSPDRSGNPFAFSFKKQKIETNSGRKLLNTQIPNSKPQSFDFALLDKITPYI